MKSLPILLFTALTNLSGLAMAEAIPGTNFDIHFESANLVGTGRSINIHRVPIYTSGSTTPTYFDATFKLSMDATGNLVFDGFTKAVPSELNSNQNFIPGKYKDQAGHELTVSGGGVGGGRVQWSITGTKEWAFDASWATGSPVGNPFIGTFAMVPKLIEGQSYGVMGITTFNWAYGVAIGVSQAGKSIIFTNYGSYDNKNGIAFGTFVINLVE